jgi:hypothetical protein
LFVSDPDFDWNGWSMDLAPVIGPHDDVIAIHDGRLISFDTALGTIRWQLQSQFTGQPSLADGHIYAVNNGRLVVIDELTHQELWSWQPPGGALTGPMIVTRTHLLASTASTVHAVDLLTRQSVWSWPVAGHLALADDTLYVASTDGTLTAFTAPQVIPSPLTGLELSGPSQVVEGSVTLFKALAHYANGSIVDRTALVKWSVQPDRFASIAQPGALNAGLLIDLFHDVLLRAEYVEFGQQADAEQGVRLVIGVTGRQLVERNLTAAASRKQTALEELAAALELERASRAALAALPPGPWSLQAMPLLLDSICREEDAREAIDWSLYDLARIMELPWQPGTGSAEGVPAAEPPAPRPRPERCRPAAPPS